MSVVEGVHNFFVEIFNTANIRSQTRLAQQCLEFVTVETDNQFGKISKPAKNTRKKSQGDCHTLLV